MKRDCTLAVPNIPSIIEYIRYYETNANYLTGFSC